MTATFFLNFYNSNENLSAYYFKVGLFPLFKKRQYIGFEVKIFILLNSIKEEFYYDKL